MELTMRESWWLYSGGLGGTGRVIRYEVDGLLPMEQISIHNFGNDRHPSWSILHVNQQYFSGWKGEYRSAEEALETVPQTPNIHKRWLR